MTRKDYILIAAALKEAPMTSFTDPQLIRAASYQHAACVVAIAHALARDNPRFDRERFLKAAGVQS